ncbi:MAG: hypothetical protein KIT09_18930 [Bryobacteraceae bacterium]|nr:hypothetical protein [Bryobacteraceae bacterium]
MRKAILLSCLTIAGIVLSAPAPANGGPRDHKVAICHVPPGNPANAHTIVIDYHAVPAHLAHGDYEGACGDGGGGGPE